MDFATNYERDQKGAYRPPLGEQDSNSPQAEKRECEPRARNDEEAVLMSTPTRSDTARGRILSSLRVSQFPFIFFVAPPHGAFQTHVRRRALNLDGNWLTQLR